MVYDVVAVNIKTKLVRLLARDETQANAEAVVLMAVRRRGVDEEFFVAVEAGTYQEGESWVGQRPVRVSHPSELPKAQAQRMIKGV